MMQHFSTDHVPESDRLAFLHDFVGRHVARRQFSPQAGTHIRIGAAVMTLTGQVTVGSASYSPLTGRRTRMHTADGRDDYLLTIHDQDHELVINGGPPVLVRAGDMMLVSEATPSEFRLPQIGLDVISLSRSRLADLLPRIDGNASYHVPGDTPSLSLLRGYARLLRHEPPADDRARAMAARHLTELVALVLDGFIEGETAGSERSIRAARLAVVKRAILGRLGDPDLNVAAIAGSQGVSVRYLQRLFEAEGRTFSEFLRDSRLDLALRCLREAGPGSAGISAIAYDCGFNDLSHFNRSFRRRFGMTPSEVRAEALRGQMPT